MHLEYCVLDSSTFEFRQWKGDLTGYTVKDAFTRFAFQLEFYASKLMSEWIVRYKPKIIIALRGLLKCKLLLLPAV